MTYTILYQQMPSGAESQHWTKHLLEAKLHAREVVTCGSAESAEVRDARGKVVYRFPEDEPASVRPAAGSSAEQP